MDDQLNFSPVTKETVPELLFLLFSIVLLIVPSMHARTYKNALLRRFIEISRTL